MSCVDFEVNSPIMVDANIQRWTITNDNIYLIKFNEEPPQWLEDQIQNIIDDTGLVDDVDNLTDRFNNFLTGYTEHFYDWQDGDEHTLAYVENIYTTNVAFNAGIQEIKVAYVSHNESGAWFDSLIGAWQTGAGGAWFNEQVSVVSNVAYSAAKSASTLTATLVSQQDQLEAIAGDIEILEKQQDGKVETFTGYHPVVEADGTLIPTAEPYVTWAAEGTIAEHTGDTYVMLEKDANDNDAIVGLWGFTYDFNNSTYNWIVITDTLAAQAYETALEAGVLADGKINTYYQEEEPNIVQDPTMGDGDLWIDSNDKNKMYRYNGTDWLPVRDTDITASVNRLDQATVDIDGIATAKSSLAVDADGNISGFIASASSDPDEVGSIFRIFADRFVLADTAGQPASDAPFVVEDGKITFNGIVEFKNITGSETVVTEETLTEDLARSTTIIDGSRIITGSLDANLANIVNINASKITAGVIYNTGGSNSNYRMKIDLGDNVSSFGEIHIK